MLSILCSLSQPCFNKTCFFKGRDPDETSQMMQRIATFNKAQHLETDKVRISLDMEKIRCELDALVPFVDVVFLSKDLAVHWGSTNKIDALDRFTKKFPNRSVEVILLLTYHKFIIIISFQQMHSNLSVGRGWCRSSKRSWNPGFGKYLQGPRNGR